MRRRGVCSPHPGHRALPAERRRVPGGRRGAVRDGPGPGVGGALSARAADPGAAFAAKGRGRRVCRGRELRRALRCCTGEGLRKPPWGRPGARWSGSAAHAGEAKAVSRGRARRAATSVAVRSEERSGCRRALVCVLVPLPPRFRGLKLLRGAVRLCAVTWPLRSG